MIAALLLAAQIVGAPLVTAPSAPPPQMAARGPAPPFDYRLTLKHLQAGNTFVDYRALRMASSRQKGFSGYDRFDTATAEQLAEANDNAKLRKLAEKHLSREYLDPNAHLWLARACRALKDEPCATFHLAVREGLLRSIAASGDGRSAATAFRVIGVDEEYALMRSMGLSSEGQSLDTAGGVFDVVHARNEKDERFDLWFDISAFFGRR